MSPDNDTEFPYDIELFSKERHERSVFTCGEEKLDRYLKRQANQDLKRKLSVTYVLIKGDCSDIIGYYTLSHFSVNFNELPSNIQSRLPRYPKIPATLIGRLAVDEEHQGDRLGEHLLLDALNKSYKRTLEMGSFAVVVDLLVEGVREFYLQYDFRALPNDKGRLFIPMKKVGKLLETTDIKSPYN